jgi:predicted RNase H-like nuclease
VHIAGVDGCRGGWLCIDELDGALRGQIFESLSDLLKGLPTASVVAIDIPIGLPDSGERECDRLARKLLRAPRASSVFPAPVQAVVGETDYLEACRKHRDIDGRALSRQAFAILPKIREVNLLLVNRPALQDRVKEVHPEVCFAAWNDGTAMRHRKSDSLGRAEREQLIDAAWPGRRQRVVAGFRRGAYQPDDVNDAFAALWTARRIFGGTADVLGAGPIDRHGLRMEMWA